MHECLHDAIKSQNCPKALSTFLKFYNQESSKINSPRTNINAERAVKKMQEIIENSRSEKYLSSKILLQTIFNEYENLFNGNNKFLFIFLPERLFTKHYKHDCNLF